MRYLLIHRVDETAELSAAKDADADGPVARAIQDWVTEMETSGVKLYGGRLQPVSEAKTIRVRGGEVLVSDGPFAETKEQVAGFDVLECAGLAEAIEVASRHPTARFGAFELRPFRSP